MMEKKLKATKAATIVMDLVIWLPSLYGPM